jgi:hypothetical protein
MRKFEIPPATDYGGKSISKRNKTGKQSGNLPVLIRWGLTTGQSTEVSMK